MCKARRCGAVRCGAGPVQGTGIPAVNARKPRAAQGVLLAVLCGGASTLPRGGCPHFPVPSRTPPPHSPLPVRERPEWMPGCLGAWVKEVVGVGVRVR